MRALRRWRTRGRSARRTRVRSYASSTAADCHRTRCRRSSCARWASGWRRARHNPHGGRDDETYHRGHGSSRRRMEVGARLAGWADWRGWRSLPWVWYAVRDVRRLAMGDERLKIEGTVGDADGGYGGHGRLGAHGAGAPRRRFLLLRATLAPDMPRAA